MAVTSIFKLISLIHWHLSATRKRNVRKRLKSADDVVEKILATGLRFKKLDEIAAQPREHEMNPKNKYFVFSKNHRGLLKGVHMVPKFTRVEIPRTFPVGLRNYLNKS